MQTEGEDRDREQFMDELEEDPEFRATVTLHAEANAEQILAESQTRAMATGDDGDDDDEDEEDFPEIQLEELVTATQQMKI